MRKIFLFILLTSVVFPQVVSDYTYISSEAAAMAGAMTANPGSVASLFHNPAGIAELEDPFIEFGKADIFGVESNYFGGFSHLPIFGNSGLSIQQSKTVVSGTTLSKEQSIAFSSGFHLQKDRNSQLMVGYSFNYLSWNLGRSSGTIGDGSDGQPSSSSSTLGIDVGLIASLRGKHRVGAYLKNINSPEMGRGESRQPLPRRMSIGMAYTPYQNFLTSLVLDRTMGRDDIQVKGGIQYIFTDMCTLRLGLQSNPNRLGAGFRFSFRKYGFDYALLTHPVLPATHHFSFGMEF